MKRALCLIFLIGVLSGITEFTIYTLNNKGIREEVENKVVKNIEKVTSNLANNTYTEIYNIYLNKEKHKLKMELVYKSASKLNKVSLLMYFDGRNIFEEEVYCTEFLNINDLVNDANFINDFLFKESSLQILTRDNVDYLVIDVKYNKENIKEKYFIYDNEGSLLTDGDGILVKDNSYNLVDENLESLDIFYGDNEEQLMAKIEDNIIYALVLKKSKKSMKIEEYKYVIQERVLAEELINSYENIKIKSIEE